MSFETFSVARFYWQVENLARLGNGRDQDVVGITSSHKDVPKGVLVVPRSQFR